MKKHAKNSLFEEYSDKDIREWLTIFDLSDDPVELTEAIIPEYVEKYGPYKKEDLEWRKQILERAKKKNPNWFHQTRSNQLLGFADSNGYDAFFNRLHDIIIDDAERFGVTAEALMSTRDGVFYSV